MSTSWPEVSIQVPRRRPWWRRWLRRVLVAALTLVIAAGVAYACVCHQIASRLNQAVAKLDGTEPGWRLHDLEAARAAVPGSENSAPVVVAAGRLLPEKWPAEEIVNTFAGLAPNEALGPAQFDLLRGEIKRLQPALEEARPLAGLPRGRHRAPRAGPTGSLVLDDQRAAKRVAELLRYESMLHAQNGDGKAAVTSCRAALNAARSVGDEPAPVPQQFRMAGVRAACQAVERALAQGQPPPDDLAALQRLFEDEDRHPALLALARGLRAHQHESFRAVDSGEIGMRELAGPGPPPSAWEEIYSGIILSNYLRAEETHILDMTTRWVAASRLPDHRQAGAEREIAAAVRAAGGENWLAKPHLCLLLLPLLERASAEARQTRALVRCTAVALAAERYRLQEGAWPVSPGEMTPGLLAEVPLDPYDGQPLRYRRTEDGVVVYAVGDDGVDNGGNLDRERPNQPGVDVGFRLWDVKHRRRPPRPKEQAPEGPKAPGGPPP